MWNPRQSDNVSVDADIVSLKCSGIDKAEQLKLENVYILVVSGDKKNTRYYVVRPGLREKNYAKNFLLNGVEISSFVKKVLNNGDSIKKVSMRCYRPDEVIDFYNLFLAKALNASTLKEKRKNLKMCLKILEGIQSDLNRIWSEYEDSRPKTKTIGQKKEGEILWKTN